MPASEQGASPHIDAAAAMLKPAGAAQLQASQHDQPSVLGRQQREQAPADTAPAQAAPEAHKADRRTSITTCKSAAAPQGPAQAPGPQAQKPVMARTRRQTLAAAGHATGPLPQISQPDNKVSRSDRLTSPAEDGPCRLVATQEIAPRAKQTRRASVAPQLRGLAETAKQGTAGPLPADRPKRRRGASMAKAPDQAAAAEEAEPQPPAKVAWRRTGVPRMTATPDQDAAQISSAFAPPALCSLETINEDMDVEDHREEEAGPSCTDAVGSAHKQRGPAPATEGGTQQLYVQDACDAPAHGERSWGGQRVGVAGQTSSTAIPSGCSDRQLPEENNQQLPVSSKQHAQRGDSEQVEGPVRRSARRAVLAARPLSAQGQPARPRSASPVMDQAIAPAGDTAACTSCAAHCASLSWPMLCTAWGHVAGDQDNFLSCYTSAQQSLLS